MLTVHAQRRRNAAEGVELLVGEHPQGTFSRQMFLGEGLAGIRRILVLEAEVAVLRAQLAELDAGGGAAAPSSGPEQAHR